MSARQGLNFKLLLKNTIVAFSAQGISLFVSAIMSLVVPKILGLASYGYWQLFVFYASYSGFFHFGLNDGIYLIEGGNERTEINKRKIAGLLQFEIIQQLVVAGVISVFACAIAPDCDRFFVIAAFAIYTVICNLSGLIGYLFQAMNETKLFSFSTMVDRLSFLFFLLICVYFRIEDFKIYVTCYIFARMCCLAYCCYNAREFIVSARPSFRESLIAALFNMKVGCSLMFANIADILILGVARALVDSAWGIEVFGKVSFSLSLVNFFIAFVSQAAMVLFPALRQGSDAERRRFYRTARNAIELVFPCIYLLYFPIVWVLGKWLPQFTDSYIYFAILLPVCVFDTKMNICCTTFFKVLREERVLLWVNLATVAGSAFLSLIGVYFYHSLAAVLIGAVICIIARSIWCENHLNKRLEAPSTLLPAEEAIITALFIFLTLYAGKMEAIFAYTCIYLLYLVINRNSLVELMHALHYTFRN